MVVEAFNAERLSGQAESWRAQGKTLVLANGAFDLLHVGHLRYLQAAALEGDLLIVAVNSDSSVRLSKGDDRPVIPENERAELIAGLRGVAHVIIFSDQSVEPIISSLRPNVHAKGTDYTVDSVPEGDLVRSLGGEVRIVGDPKDHSSSETIRRLR